MKLPSQPNRRRALTRIEVVVIVAALAFFAWLLRLKFIEARTKAERIKCVGNNKQVGLSFRIWAYHNDDKYPYLSPSNSSAGKGVANLAYRNESDAWLHFLVMSNEVGSPKILMCPSDKARLKHMTSSFSSNSSPQHFGLQFTRNSGVSYFTGLEADETQPRGLLAGDRNLETNIWNFREPLLTVPSTRPARWTTELHGGCGTVTLADGSMLWGNSPTLEHQLLPGGLLTNRLLLPLVP